VACFKELSEHWAETKEIHERRVDSWLPGGLEVQTRNQTFMTELTDLVKNEILFLTDERSSVRKRSNHKSKETYSYSLWTLHSKTVSNRSGKRVWILRLQFTQWHLILVTLFCLTELQLQVIKTKSLLYKWSSRLQKQKDDAYLITDISVSCGKNELHNFGVNILSERNIYNIPCLIGPDIYIYISGKFIVVRPIIQQNIEIGIYDHMLFPKYFVYYTIYRICFNSDVYWTVHHCNSWRIKKTTRCHLLFLFYFLETQHVSGIKMPIFRSMLLYCWTTTLAISFLVCCVL